MSAAPRKTYGGHHSQHQRFEQQPQEPGSAGKPAQRRRRGQRLGARGQLAGPRAGPLPALLLLLQFLLANDPLQLPSSQPLLPEPEQQGGEEHATAGLWRAEWGGARRRRPVQGATGRRHQLAAGRAPGRQASGSPKDGACRCHSSRAGFHTGVPLTCSQLCTAKHAPRQPAPVARRR